MFEDAIAEAAEWLFGGLSDFFDDDQGEGMGIYDAQNKFNNGGNAGLPNGLARGNPTGG